MRWCSDDYNVQQQIHLNVRTVCKNMFAIGFFVHSLVACIGPYKKLVIRVLVSFITTVCK